MKVENSKFSSVLIHLVYALIFLLFGVSAAYGVDNCTVVAYYHEPWEPWGDTVKIINANPLLGDPHGQLAYNIDSSTDFRKMGQIFKPVEDFNLGAVAVEIGACTIRAVECDGFPFKIQIFTMSDANAIQPDDPCNPIATFEGTFPAGFSDGILHTDWAIFYFDQPTSVALTSGSYYGFLFSFVEEHPTLDPGGGNQYFEFGMDTSWFDPSGRYQDGRRFANKDGVWENQGTNRISLEFAVLSEGDPIPLCVPLNEADLNGDCETNMEDLKVLTDNWLDVNTVAF